MWELLLIGLAFSDCIKKNYFTECSSQQTHDAIITGSEDCVGEYPQIFKSLDCTYSCSAGYVLDISNGHQYCSKCPSGTFNIGGGFIYGGSGQDWSTALKSVINECYLITDYLHYRNYNCTGWIVEDNILMSGRTPLDNVYSAGLLLSIKVVKPGTVSVVYRKDTVRVNGSKIGSFSIYVDHQQVYYENNIQQTSWVFASFNIDSGSHSVYFEYKTLRSVNNPNPHAYISTIYINGTSYSATECFACLSGAVFPGATSCNPCDFNQYLQEGGCLNCSASTYSLKGAVGSDSCKPRLPCTENDYIKVFSACINNSRKQTYKWKQPLLCDYLNYSLPTNVLQVPCEQCQKGYLQQTINGVSECVACPDGKYLNENTQNQCLNCSEGTYAWKSFDFTDWNSLPEGFDSYCIHTDGSTCKDSIGWIASNSYISSGSYLTAHSELFLNKNFFVEAFSGVLSFSYEILNLNGGFFDVYVDFVWVTTKFSQEDNVSIALTPGDHYFQWVYWPSNNSNEEVRIKKITISGSTEGGASICIKCLGGFISGRGQSTCTPCQPGYTSNSDNTKCVKCSDYHFSPGGTKCMKCPPGTTNNINKTACVGTDYAYFDDKTFYLRYITGRGPTEKEYTQGICNTQASKLYCYQTFYGPLSGENKEFYVSVLNPSELQLPSVDYYYKPSVSYAYAIVKRKDIAKIDENNQNSCSSTENIISLGTVVSGISVIDNGFKVIYSSGDICDKNKNTYSMQLNLICDKSAMNGWPSYNNTEGCSFTFVWNTRYGCPLCMYDQLITIYSQCTDGIRIYSKIEGEGCILPFSDDWTWTEPCSEIEDYITSWPMILGFSLLSGLGLLGTISFGCFWKYQRGYRRLIEVRD